MQKSEIEINNNVLKQAHHGPNNPAIPAHSELNLKPACALDAERIQNWALRPRFLKVFRNIAAPKYH